MAKRLKRPRDPGQLAKLIGDIAMDDVVRVVEEWERARLLPANDAERAMANPNNSGDMDERRKLLKLLDRLDAVHPKCMPDVIVGQWLHGDADARRKIEEAIDRMPKNSN